MGRRREAFADRCEVRLVISFGCADTKVSCQIALFIQSYVQDPRAEHASQQVEQLSRRDFHDLIACRIADVHRC